MMTQTQVNEPLPRFAITMCDGSQTRQADVEAIITYSSNDEFETRTIQTYHRLTR